jgi:hypothetical protein
MSHRERMPRVGQSPQFVHDVLHGSVRAAESRLHLGQGIANRVGLVASHQQADGRQLQRELHDLGETSVGEIGALDLFQAALDLVAELVHFGNHLLGLCRETVLVAGY